MQPVLFLSHGSPMLALQDSPAHDFIASLGNSLKRPKAVLIVSAHWETETPTVNAVTINDTIYDFRGFPQALFDMHYPAPGSPALAHDVAESLGVAGLRAKIDGSRGLDHGAWVPLTMMWPDHDIPVVQLSIQSRLGPGHHVQVGRALSMLRQDNVLIVASGSFTHNLRMLDRTGASGEPEWATQFSDWMHAAIVEHRTADLVCYRRLAPSAEVAHPTDEHLLPLFVAIGAAGQGALASRIYQSTELGSLRMDSYRFD